MTIDIHSHAIPRKFVDFVRENPERFQTKIINENGKDMVVHDQGFKYPLYPGFYDTKIRIADMDKRKIDREFVSVSPQIYYYWLDAKTALEAAMLANDGIAEMCAEAPDRFYPMATVPLQDVDASCREIERVVAEHGFKAVQIGTSMEGKYFDKPEFLPFFKKCEELGVIILFHPYYVGATKGLEDYYLTNFIGNPLDSTICISRLLFGGVMKACPESKFVFVHGGGYIPYQRGRLKHGHSVREESKVVIGSDDIDPYIDMLYFDTITHWDTALEFLINSHTSKKVVVGSDYPFDMADAEPARRVMGLENISQDQKEDVLSGNILNVLLK